jgi:hypothetical protein
MSIPSDLRDLYDEWPKQWAVRRFMLIALLLGLGIGYGVSEWRSIGTISVLRERIALLQESKGPETLHIVEVTKGPTYRVQENDDVIHVNLSDGSLKVLLPSGLRRGKHITVKDKKGEASTVPIKVTSDGGDIDGLKEVEVVTNNGWFSFIWDGTAWSMN